MDLFGIGASVQAGASIANNLANIAATAKQNKLNRKFQEQQQEKKYANDLAQWNRQNTYNTPSAQMSRFTDAGLNKNLIYGQGSAGNATSSPSYQMANYQGKIPNLDFSQIGNVVQTYQNLKLGAAQIDQLKAAKENQLKDLEVKDSVIMQNRAKLLNTNLDSNTRKLTNSYLSRSLDSRVQQEELKTVQQKTGLEQMKVQIANTKQSTKNAIQNLLNLKAQKKNTEANAYYTQQRAFMKAHDLAIFDKIHDIPTTAPFGIATISALLSGLFGVNSVEQIRNKFYDPKDPEGGILYKFSDRNIYNKLNGLLDRLNHR